MDLDQYGPYKGVEEKGGLLNPWKKGKTSPLKDNIFPLYYRNKTTNSTGSFYFLIHRLNQRRFYYCMSILHHQVQLVHHTNKGDELVAYMARVSNPSNQNNTKTSAKLIKYLIEHHHWSPFEMVNMCVEIETTRSIAAQILRHRSFSFQEFSQRYADATQLGTGVQPELRLQDTKNRQNSIEVEEEDLFLQRSIQDLYRHSEKVYKELLEAGVAKECARDVLPLSTPTRMYMNGTLRSWIHYCQLRCANGTQKEHKVIADQCKQLIAMCYPQVYAAVWSEL